MARVCLLHSDFSPKSASNAIENVLNLLSDQGPTIQAGGLDFKLSDTLTNVHHLLLKTGTVRIISPFG